VRIRPAMRNGTFHPLQQSLVGPAETANSAHFRLLCRPGLKLAHGTGFEKSSSFSARWTSTELAFPSDLQQ
jgi:hypothetical protein